MTPLPHRAIPILAVLLTATAAVAGQTRKTEYSDIKNFLRVDEQFCTGGQPAMQDLVRMKDEGIKAVVNLRRTEEFDAAAEATEAQELGLRYFLIPVDSKHPHDAQADEFLRALADPGNRPAFIHCRSGNRVGAFWMIRRVLVDGWKVDDAEREAEKIGLHSQELRAFAREYIGRHTKKAAAP